MPSIYYRVNNYPVISVGVAEGGLFAGGIWDYDSVNGNSVGSLVEGWLGGEGPVVGAAKIISATDTSILKSFLGFGGLGISAGPLAGLQVGFAGGTGLEWSVCRRAR
jgi:hypothetical protein